MKIEHVFFSKQNIFFNKRRGFKNKKSTSYFLRK